jgi:hypothetical protein
MPFLEGEHLDEARSAPASRLNDDQTGDLLEFAGVKRGHGPVPMELRGGDNQVVRSNQAAGFGQSCLDSGMCGSNMPANVQAVAGQIPSKANCLS